jgi:hypothetical protein
MAKNILPFMILRTRLLTWQEILQFPGHSLVVQRLRSFPHSLCTRNCSWPGLDSSVFALLMMRGEVRSAVISQRSPISNPFTSFHACGKAGMFPGVGNGSVMASSNS